EGQQDKPVSEMSVKLIPFHTLAITEKIGAGRLGTVYKGVYRLIEQVAIKEITGIDGAEAQAQFKREAQIMKTITNEVSGKHFAFFYGICCEENRQYLIMEYLSGGTLANYLTKPLSKQTRHQLCLNIIAGLYLLHDANIYHRDLTSANILISEHGEAKLADFGLAKVQQAVAETVNKKVQASASKFRIMAPERMQAFYNGDSDDKGDIYSFGILLFEIMAKRTAYTGLSDLQIIDKVLLKGEREPIPPEVPEFYRDLIIQCWSQLPEQRPTAYELWQILQKVPDFQKITEKGMEAEKIKDFNEAATQYKKAAFYGEPRAQANLALLMFEGKGNLVKDDTKSRELLYQSAMGDHPRGMINLAYFYEKGLGGDPDIDKAKRWLTTAANTGDERAKQRLEKLNEPQNSPTRLKK
ncbi:MAG: Sel1-like repeat-containing protein kinase family protein, partial [Gammaproteobacteria bacterium]